ncbi:MAG: iron donor protein CyaY [Proteobacteria bacterium]|nr:iron donor protein CyaY [Pseudomonadota bacterium]
MDEQAYLHLADATFGRLMDALSDVDPEVVDCERAGDVVTLTFADGRRSVLNTQRPTRQLWLAGGESAWHFSYQSTTGRWIDDKGRGELFAILGRLVRDASGLELDL